MLDFVDPSASSQVDFPARTDLEPPSTTARRFQDGMDLRQGSFADRWEVAKRIPQRGEAALADLIAMVRDETLTWETRWLAARSLGSFDHPAAIAALMTALGTADEDLQEAILDALCHIGPSAIQSLSDLVAEPTYQAVAIEALTRIPHPATQAPLVTAVDLTTGATQAKVIEALGQFADLALLPIFTEAVQNRASSVRLAALQGLIRLRTQVDESHWTAWIQPLTEDVNPAVAQRAIHALGRTTNLAATQTLQGLLAATHTPESLKIAAAQALAWQGTVAALAVLIDAWDTLGQNVRIALVQGLSQISHPNLKAEMIAPVQRWLNGLPATTEYSLLRRNLVMLLGQVGGDSVIPLLQTLRQDADTGIRFHAEAALRSVS
ncbi:MAG: HEAT repeat domain-containing protein [Spirulina sp.]